MIVLDTSVTMAWFFPDESSTTYVCNLTKKGRALPWAP